MPLSDPARFQQAFGALLADPDGQDLDPALLRALTIHRNTAVKAAVEALGDNYPVIRALVGEEAFTAVSLDYVADHPPTDPRLCDYGHGFGDYLAGYSPFAELPYLGDCALIERAVIEALFAADAPTASGGDFSAGVDPDQMLALHPATRQVVCAAPAGSIWLAHQPQSALDLAQLTWRAEVSLVTRPDSNVRVQVLEPAAAAFLAAVLEKATMGEAAEAASHLGEVSDAFFTLLAAGAFLRPGQGGLIA
jgi:hypothetical protein